VTNCNMAGGPSRKLAHGRYILDTTALPPLIPRAGESVFPCGQFNVVGLVASAERLDEALRSNGSRHPRRSLVIYKL
jgi:hypothetical protein